MPAKKPKRKPTKIAVSVTRSKGTATVKRRVAVTTSASKAADALSAILGSVGALPAIPVAVPSLGALPTGIQSVVAPLKIGDTGPAVLNLQLALYFLITRGKIALD